MKKLKVFDQSLPILAQAYAKKFGVKVRIQGLNAFTDGKVITIPRLMEDAPNVCRIACGYLAHEAGHIRYTDFEVVNTSYEVELLAHLFNIIEDRRIEYLMGKQYIGVFENLELLARTMFNEYCVIAKTKTKKDQVQINDLFACMCIHMCRQVNKYNIDPDVEQLIRQRALSYLDNNEQLLARLLTMLNGIERMTSKDILKLCRDIIKVINKFNPSLSGSQNDLQPQEIEKEKDIDDPLVDPTLINPLTRKILNDAAGAQSPRSGHNNLDPKNLLEKFILNESSTRDDLGLVESEKCTAGERDLRQLIKGNLRGAKNKISNAARAYVYHYANLTCLGDRIDARRAIKMSLGESKIFKHKTVIKDYNTTVQLLVDASGSMLSYGDDGMSRMDHANLYALMSAMALDNVDGIKCGVTYFPGYKCEYSECIGFNDKLAKNILRFDQQAHGSTPLAQALWGALNNVKKERSERNLIIVFTDGVPDSVTQAKKALAACDAAGVEVYMIGIEVTFVKALHKNSVVVRSPEQAVDAVSRKLESYFKIMEEDAA